MLDEEEVAVGGRGAGGDEGAGVVEGEGGLVDDLVGEVVEDGGLIDDQFRGMMVEGKGTWYVRSQDGIFDSRARWLS